MFLCVCLCVLTLPEREKDNWLDHEELEHGVVWDKQFTCGKVEEEESVEWQTDGDVVDNSHVQVATGHTEEERQTENDVLFKLTIKVIYNQPEASSLSFEWNPLSLSVLGESDLCLMKEAATSEVFFSLAH